MDLEEWRHKASVARYKQLVNLDERYTVLGTIFKIQLLRFFFPNKKS